MTDRTRRTRVQRAHSTHRRRLTVGLSLLLISTVTCLLILEGAVRLLKPQQLVAVWMDTFQPADSIGWRFTPNIDQQINTGERSVRFVTDHDGFRIDPAGGTSADARVILIGDSFMAAIQVEYEETFAAHMERGLNARLGRPVEVRNVSAGGWDPPQYLIMARRLLASAPVDMVVVSVYVGNDVVSEPMRIHSPLQLVPVRPFRIPLLLSYTEFIDAIVRPADDRLKRRSHLYILAKNRAAHLRMRLGLTAAWFPDVHLRSMADSPGWGYTVDILDQIRDAAADHGVPSAFILVPSHFQVDQTALERHMSGFDVDPEDVLIDQPNEILSRHMRERGLQVIDPLPGMRHQFRATGEPLFGRVDTHLSAEGHRVMWELVADDIARVFVRRAQPIRGNLGVRAVESAQHWRPTTGPRGRMRRWGPEHWLADSLGGEVVRSLFPTDPGSCTEIAPPSACRGAHGLHNLDDRN
jgi:hypothetical protein